MIFVGLNYEEKFWKYSYTNIKNYIKFNNQINYVTFIYL